MGQAQGVSHSLLWDGQGGGDVLTVNDHSPFRSSVINDVTKIPVTHPQGLTQSHLRKSLQ